MILNELNLGIDVTPILRADPERLQFIDNWFRSKGFDEITSGLTATSYIFTRPNDNYVIKFTNTPDPCYMRFVSYIEANKSNPHLPQITKMLRFKKDPNYILIGIEKLEEANFEGNFEAKMMWTIQDAFDVAIFKKVSFIEALSKSIQNYKLDLTQAKAVLKKNYQLFKTIMDIKRRLVKGECRYDLHPGNFMKRADGTIVIIDPLI